MITMMTTVFNGNAFPRYSNNNNNISFNCYKNSDGQSKQATIYGEMKELSVTLHCTTHT